MRILFTDWDGVLATAAGHVYWIRKGEFDDEGRLFDPIACSNLQWLLEKMPELRIVISSTWRLGRTIEQLKEILKMNGIDCERLIGVTPSLSGGRGKEIDAWLKSSIEPVESFAIVDDDSDMEPHMDRLVRTRSLDGLTWICTMELAKKLGAKDLPVFLM